MTIQKIASDLEKAMAEELAAFEGFISAQSRMIEALKERNWPNLQVCLHKAEHDSARIALLEKQRVEALHYLQNAIPGPEKHFYSLVQKLDTGKNLAAIYRKLGQAVRQSECANKVTQAYTATHAELLQSMVSVLMPEKQELNYAPTGQAVNPDVEALILNKTY